VNEAIRFYADEHFPKPATQALRRRGIDVLTTQEARHIGSPDAEQLAFATAEERVIVTFDSDYLALHQSGVQHAGIAWCPEQKYNIGELVRALLLVHGVLDQQSMRNHVEYL